MKQYPILKTLLLTAVASLGLAVCAQADIPLDSPYPEATTPTGQGLLGQTYASLTYSYVDLDSSPTHADNFAFGYNQPLKANLDAVFNYDWAQTHLVGGSRVDVQDVTAGLRAFYTDVSWGKPYVEADVGYAWLRGPGGHDNSVLWAVAVGAELQLAPALTVTPYVQYADAPSLAGSGTWNFGVKANYWVDSQWAVTVGLARDDDQNMAFTVGTNFRF